MATARTDPPGRPVRHPGRRELLRALAGSCVAVVGVALGIGALLMVRGHDASAGAGPVIELPARRVQQQVRAADPGPGASPTRPVPPVAPSTAPAPARPPLTVLNNSRISDLAGRAADRFRQAGWPVAEVGSFTGRIPVTTVYYPSDREPAAHALAMAFPAVRRVLPRFDGLPGSGLTVVVTREYPR